MTNAEWMKQKAATKDESAGVCKIALAQLEEAAKERPEGYMDEVVRRGFVEGEFVYLTKQALQTLQKLYAKGKQPPSVAAMIKSATVAMGKEARAIAKGEDGVSAEEVTRRLAICKPCSSYLEAQGRCSECGCYMKFKARLRTQNCPRKKW